MLVLAEILGLIILNALIHTAFTRWKITRRTARSKSPAKLRVATHNPQHPSPSVSAFFEAAPEHGAHIRPAGIDW